MAAKKKASTSKGAGAPAFVETESFRSPRALPPLVPTGDATVDAALEALRATRTVPDETFDLFARLPPDVQEKSVLELTPEALDLGVPEGLGHGAVANAPAYDVATPKAKKAFERFFDTVYGNQRARHQHLGILTSLLARHPAGEARLLEVTLDPGVSILARGITANALVGFVWRAPAWIIPSRPRPVLEALAGLLETTPALARHATYALHALDPEGFATRLARCIAADPLDAPRTAGILEALTHPSLPTEAWASSTFFAEAFAPILASGSAAAAALAARMDPSPALADATFNYAESWCTRYPGSRPDGALVTLMLRHGDRRVASWLARSITLDIPTSNAILDALERFDDASSANALAETLDSLEKGLKKWAAEVLSRGRALVTRLARAR